MKTKEKQISITQRLEYPKVHRAYYLSKQNVEQLEQLADKSRWPRSSLVDLALTYFLRRVRLCPGDKQVNVNQDSVREIALEFLEDA